MSVKVKFKFILKNGKIVTNDRMFNEEIDSEMEEDCGCIVEFDNKPTQDDIKEIINLLWCQYLQWMYNESLDKIEFNFIE